jgi:hypothetical protein
MNKSFQKRVVDNKLYIYNFYYYHWVDTSAGGPVVNEGIIRRVVSDSALTCYVTYISMFEIYSSSM